MTTLSSLLIARKAASIADLDEALARQVVDGGDLATCLLELGVTGESALSPLLVEAFGLESAGAGELPAASLGAIALIPRAVALRYGIFPVDERAGELSVVVSEPLPRAVENDLAFALGTRLRQRIAPLVRIHQAIARDYGGPLDPRFSRLLTKLDGAAPSLRVAAPRVGTSGERRTQTLPVGSYGFHVGAAAAPSTAQSEGLASASSTGARVARWLPGRTTPVRHHTWPGIASPAGAGASLGSMVVPESVAPVLVAVPTSSPPSVSAPAAPIAAIDGESAPPRDEGVERRVIPPPADFAMEASTATAEQVEKKRHYRAGRPSGETLVGWARRVAGSGAPAARPASRRRGPLTPADAERELEEAQTGEEVLGIFFAFARQYFEYSALFVVHGDLAEGHEAWGPGASRDRVRAIGVALDLPSALSEARARAAPLIVALGNDGLDAGMREDLRRLAPADVLIMPIVVVRRSVALLYGDEGEHAVELGEIGDVLSIARLAERALERILRLKKRSAHKDSASAPGAAESRAPAPESRAPGPTSASAGPSQAVEASAAQPSRDDAPEIMYSEAPADPALLSEPGEVDEGEDVPLGDTPVPGGEPVGPITRAPAPPPPSIALETGVGSARFSVEPHSVPASRAPRPLLPTVLIRSDLVDQVIAGGEEGERALGEILELGEAAIPSVFARFPGPLVVDRTLARGDLPRPADCGPVLRVVAAMRRLALPFLAVRSGDADVEVRFWATYLLGELHYPDTAAALLPRLFDENMTVRRVAVRSARALVAGDDEAAIPLRRNLERMVAYPDDPEASRLIAISTVSELRLYRSIPALIASLSDPSPLVTGAAMSALVTMTRQEFGRDPRKWGDWWETRGKKRLR